MELNSHRLNIFLPCRKWKAILVCILLILTASAYSQDLYAPLWYSNQDQVKEIGADLKPVKEIQFKIKSSVKTIPLSKLSALSGSVSIADIGSQGYFVFNKYGLEAVCFLVADADEVARQVKKNLGKNRLVDERGTTDPKIYSGFNVFLRPDSDGVILIADDIQSYYSDQGLHSLFGDDLKPKVKGQIRAVTYNLPRSKVIVLIDSKTNIGAVIEIQDVSHLNGIYTGDGSAEVYILDNQLYYVIRLPEPSPTIGIADVTKYPLSVFDEVYKYQEENIIFLNVSTLGSRFILDDSSRDHTEAQLSGILNENANILHAQRQREEGRKVVR